MSHKPLTTMKALQRSSRQPLLKSERPITVSTMDARHNAEQARRSAIQRTSNVKARPGK